MNKINPWMAVPYIPLSAALLGFGGVVIIAALQTHLHEKQFASALCALTPTVASMAIILSILMIFTLFCAQERINEFHRRIDQIRLCSIADSNEDCLQNALTAMAPYDHSHSQSFQSIAGVGKFILHLIIGFNSLFVVICAYHGPWPTIFYPLFIYLALSVTGITGLWLIISKLENSAQTLAGQISPLTPENTAAEGWNRYTDGGRLLGHSGFNYHVCKGELLTVNHLRNFWHCLYVGTDVEHPQFIAIIPCSEKMVRPLFLQMALNNNSFGFSQHLRLPSEAVIPAIQYPTHPHEKLFRCSFFLSPQSIQRIYTIEMQPTGISGDNFYLTRDPRQKNSVPHPAWLERAFELLPSPECRIAMWSHQPDGIDPDNFISGIRHSLERSALLLPDRAGLYTPWRKSVNNN